MTTNRAAIEALDKQRRAELLNDQMINPHPVRRTDHEIEARQETLAARPHWFKPADIATLKSMAARGASGKEIAIKLARSAHSVRVKCVELGISLRPPKREWHRLRVLVEPLLNKAIVLAARKRGMRAGELVRRLLSAILCYDLIDTILDKAASRQQKIGAIGANISRMPITKLELALAPQLEGRIAQFDRPVFEIALGR
jgi:hypothetical protein